MGDKQQTPGTAVAYAVHAEKGARNSDEFVTKLENRNEIVTNS